MDMKKISCVVIVAAASMSAVMASGVASPAATPSASLGASPVGSEALGGVAPASAPGPAEPSVATSTLPVLGSLVGAFLVSLFA
ncbi:hypothetical protein V6N13_137277 [Hibiscus sabdariffa]|uniref:Arabinogalactan peptide 23-like n=1 Tax=Hibiscus sabdariffa TaxID=183260 RepID=A0ABR2DLZ4_9ROSI